MPTINRLSHNAMWQAPVASHRLERDLLQGTAHILMLRRKKKKIVYCDNDQHSLAIS